MANIGTLQVWLKANTNQYNRKLRAARDNTNKFKMQMTKIGSMAAVGFVGAASAVIAYGDKLAGEADKVGKMSKALGINSSELQQFQFAASRAGASNTELGAGFCRMTRIISDANKGLKSAKDALAGVGLSVDDLKGKSVAEQFDLISKALNAVDDASTKAALAQELFGRSGTKLIPMLDTLQEIKQEAVDIGAIMSEDTIRAAESYEDAMTNLGVTVKSLAANAGLITWLDNVAGGLNAIAGEHNKIQLANLTKDGTKAVGYYVDFANKNKFQQIALSMGEELDSWLGGGEGERTQIITAAPTEDARLVAQREKKARIAEEERLKEKQAAAAKKREQEALEKKQEELRKKEEKAAAKKKAAELAVAARKKKAVDDDIAASKRRVEINKMWEAGKNVEARMAEQILAMKLRGVTLTEEQLAGYRALYTEDEAKKARDKEAADMARKKLQKPAKTKEPSVLNATLKGTVAAYRKEMSGGNAAKKEKREQNNEKNIATTAKYITKIFETNSGGNSEMYEIGA